MKKILTLVTILTLIILPTISQAQVTNSEMDSIKYVSQTEQYCLLVCTAKLFSTTVKVDIDFGQKVNFWGNPKQRKIIDESGNVKEFSSVIDALHYLNGLGWQFVSAYPMSSQQGQCYHYLMKRTISIN